MDHCVFAAEHPVIGVRALDAQVKAVSAGIDPPPRWRERGAVVALGEPLPERARCGDQQQRIADIAHGIRYLKECLAE